MKKLIFGTAGIPHSTEPRNTEEGIKEVNSLGLGAMELEFVRSIHIRKEKAPDIKKIAEKENVTLTCHAPYWINLNAKEPEKRKASIERILNSTRITHLCGGWSVCFHPGYYMKMPVREAYDNVRESIGVIIDTLKEEDIDIWIRPEIGGKITSFGSLEEIIQISKELKQVEPCIDWAHLYARSLGKINRYDQFMDILKSLGKSKEKMHCHVEGIEFTEKGEKRHVDLKESKFNYKDLVKAFVDSKMKGVVICESPSIEKDALLLKDLYNSK